MLIMLPLDIFHKISCWPDTAVVLDFCNKIESSYSCIWSPALNVLLKRWFDRISCRSSGACRGLTTGGCVFLFCNPICPSLALREIGTLQIRTVCAAATRWVHHGCMSGQWFCSSPWYRLKASPVSRRACVQVLFSLAREGGGNLFCLGLWKCLRKLQICRYCINFLISDPYESFVVFFKLFHNGFFRYNAAIASPAMRGQSGKYQQFVIWFSCRMYRIVYSSCVCQCVLCGATFSFRVCGVGMRYCEMVFVQVPQVGYVCVINYVCAQWLQNKTFELN